MVRAYEEQRKSDLCQVNGDYTGAVHHFATACLIDEKAVSVELTETRELSPSSMNLKVRNAAGTCPEMNRTARAPQSP